MDFRSLLFKLKEEKKVFEINREVDVEIETATVLKSAEPTPVLFNSIKGFSDFRVAGNICCTKQAVADYLGVTNQELIPRLIEAIENPSEPEVINDPICQEVVITAVDLNKLPILRYYKDDGGRYISSAVVITKDPEYGQNLDFHRAMQLGNSKNRMSTRIIKGRDFYKFLERNEEVEVAYCIGNSPNVLVAAATSVKTGLDELEIANSLSELTVAKAKIVDLLIPSNCEIVLEGRVFLNDREEEGPFIDLTETYDVVREEPVFEVKKITHRKNPIFQVLLPGGAEHKVLMGMPREPTIFREVNKSGVKCIDVNLSPGGSSWLHAVVKIDKKNDKDGIRAIEATFSAHKSCKHVFIVDNDINIYDPSEVEWALATRFQADQDLVNKGREPGSSLDPSAEAISKLTNKIGFDLTIPLSKAKKNFEKVKFPKVDLDEYIKEKEEI
ncbi:MAG: UbiD family decarboxylase [Candidatus Hodarchaeales archaeon]